MVKYAITLVDNGTNLNTPGTSFAKFLVNAVPAITDSFHVKVDYTAIVANTVNFVEKTLDVKVGSDSLLQFSIPNNTVGLKVDAQLNLNHDNDIRVIQYFPPVCTADFNNTNLRARCLFKILNQMALDTTSIDHTPVPPGGNYIYGQQYGPCRTSRALAMFHVSVFEAYNSIVPNYYSYIGLSPASNPHNISIPAAMLQAGYTTLISLYPSQQPRLLQLYNSILATIIDSPNAINAGIALGNTVSQLMIANRNNDGWYPLADEQVVGVNYPLDPTPGIWRPDPLNTNELALGSLWPQVKTFIIPSASIYRCPVPPALTSSEYTLAYNTTDSLGGDGVITQTARSPQETIIGIFWGYDASAVCSPAKMYNQIAMAVNNTDGYALETATLIRLFALLNVAMADAAIASWDSKYYYKYWRPVAAIRESDAGTGPSGLGDGNPNTIGDPNFTPYGTPQDSPGPNKYSTPPFPSYPSGHATFGGVLFQLLRNQYGTDTVQFSFMSDEFNGKTTDNLGNVRPVVIKTYNSFSQAEEENGQSRIYLGIHWFFDKTAGITQGNQIANYAWTNIFQSLP